MDEQIGAKIKKLRKEHKDTLKSMAEKIDYDWSNLSKVERGVYGPSVDLIRKITEVYNINPNYFFEGLTNAEGELLQEKKLDADQLRGRYRFEVDGVEATEEELMAAIRLLRQLRPKSE